MEYYFYTWASSFSELFQSDKFLILFWCRVYKSLLFVLSEAACFKFGFLGSLMWCFVRRCLKRSTRCPQFHKFSIGIVLWYTFIIHPGHMSYPTHLLLCEKSVNCLHDCSGKNHVKNFIFPCYSKDSAQTLNKNIIFNLDFFTHVWKMCCILFE